MEERYPYIRFVTGAAPTAASAVALVIVLGGTAAACETGGFGGFVSFVVTLLFASVAFIATMVSAEFLKLVLDLERHIREAGTSAGTGPTASD